MTLFAEFLREYIDLTQKTPEWDGADGMYDDGPLTLPVEPVYLYVWNKSNIDYA